MERYRPEIASTTQGANALSEQFYARPQMKRKLISVGESDLDSVSRLQKQWNRTLGLLEDRPGDMKNYNPVLARWNFERLDTKEQREQFRSNEMMNITTALRERHKTQESRLQLTIDKDGKIRNEAFPDEPYEAMLERGREYREKHGSNDLAREKAEINGFMKIQEVLTNPDTPIGSTYIVVSPPSEVENSPYGHNFVDAYQSAKDEQTGERVIDYVRFASPIDTEAYVPIAERLDPGFFERKTQQELAIGESIPTDAWYLENPFFIPSQEGQKIDQVFNEYFAEDVEAMTEKEWQKLQKIYTPGMLYLLDQITKPEFDPEAIARAHNILLLSPERNFAPDAAGEHTVFDAKTNKLTDKAYKFMAMLAQTHGHEQAEEQKVGCGTSASINIKGGEMASSVADFGKKGEHPFFVCSECGWKAEGEIGNSSCGGCGFSKADYAAKYGEVCD